jgi:ribose 5-phosphate isomerase B
MVMLVVASDHAGFALKERLKPSLKKMGIAFEDIGPKKFIKNDDYPVYAAAVAKRVRQTGSRGLLICGSGIGMAIVANKFAGIRAALVWNDKVAKMAAQEGDSNILVLPARFLSRQQAEKILRQWLETPFRQIPRYRRRLGQIARIENFKLP